MSAPVPNKTPLGRLSFADREAICQLMRERQSGRQINAWLAGKGIGPYSDQNFSNFRRTHFAKWLENQAKYDAIRAGADEIRRGCEARGETVFDKVTYDWAAAMSDVREKADEDNIAKLAAATAAILNARSNQVRAGLEAAKVAQRQDALDLEREKFRFKVADEIIRYANDARVREIASAQGSSQENRVQALLAYMDSVEQATPEE